MNINKSTTMNVLPPPIHDYSVCEGRVKSRGGWHYLKGYLARLSQYFKYAKAVRIARNRGALIGEGVIMPLSLARKANVTDGGNNLSTASTETEIELNFAVVKIIRKEDE